MELEYTILVNDQGQVQLRHHGQTVQQLGQQVRSTSRQMSASWGTVEKRIKSMHSGLRRMVTSLPAKLGFAGGVAGLTMMVNKAADAGDNFQKMALRTGVAVEALSSLSHVANIAGTNIGSLENGIRLLQRKMNDADEGLAEARRSFEAIGVDIHDAGGKLREFEDIFPDIISGINSLETDTKKAAIAQEIFGRSGTQLLPIIKQGSDAIREQIREARELGLVWSQEDANAAAEFNDNMTRLKGGLTGVRNALFNAVVPELNEFLVNATGNVKEFIESGKLKEWGGKAKEGLDKIKSGISWVIEHKDWFVSAFKVAAIGAVVIELGNVAIKIKAITSAIQGMTAAAAGSKLLSGTSGAVLGGAGLAGAAAFTGYQLYRLGKGMVTADKSVGGLQDSNELYTSTMNRYKQFLAQNADKLGALGISFTGGPNGSFRIAGAGDSGASETKQIFEKAGAVAGESFSIGFLSGARGGKVPEGESYKPEIGKVGFVDKIEDEARDVPQKISPFFFQAADILQGAFQNAFSSIMSDFTDGWNKAFGYANSVAEKFLQGFASGVLNALLSMGAQLAAAGLMSLFAPGLGSVKDIIGLFFHDGGLVGAERMHTGGLKSNEQPAILKKREFVVPDYSVNANTIGALEHIRQTGSMPGQGININRGNIIINAQGSRAMVDEMDLAVTASDEALVAALKRIQRKYK